MHLLYLKFGVMDTWEAVKQKTPYLVDSIPVGAISPKIEFRRFPWIIIFCPVNIANKLYMSYALCVYSMCTRNYMRFDQFNEFNFLNHSIATKLIWQDWLPKCRLDQSYWLKFEWCEIHNKEPVRIAKVVIKESFGLQTIHSIQGFLMSNQLNADVL